jgi:hypothetical protein
MYETYSSSVTERVVECTDTFESAVATAPFVATAMKDFICSLQGIFVQDHLVSAT